MEPKKITTKKKGKRKTFADTLLPSVSQAAKAYLDSPHALVVPPECSSKETMLAVVIDAENIVREETDRNMREAGDFECNAFGRSFVYAGKAEAMGAVEDKLYDIMRRVESLAYDAVPFDLAHRFIATIADAIRITRWRGWREGAFESHLDLPNELRELAMEPAHRMVDNVRRAISASVIMSVQPAAWLIMSPADRATMVLEHMVSDAFVRSPNLADFMNDCETALTSEQVREIGRAVSFHDLEACAKVWLGPNDALARQYVYMLCRVKPVAEGTFVKISVKNGSVETSFYLPTARTYQGRGWAHAVPGRVLFVVAKCASRG